MRIVKLYDKPNAAALFGIILGMALAAWLALYGETIHPRGAVLGAIVAALFIGIGVANIIRVYRGRSLVARLANSIHIDGSRIVLGERRRVVIGILRALSTWRGGRGLHLYTELDFEPRRELTTKIIELSELRSLSYTLVIDHRYSGYLSLPCAALDKPAKLFLCLIDPSSASIVSTRTSISAGHGKESSRARLFIDINGIRGLLETTAKLLKYTQLELLALIPLRMRTYVCRAILAKIKSGSTSFNYDFQPHKPCILIATPSSITSENIARALRIKPPTISGFSEGSYRIKLIMKHPGGLEESEYVIKS